MVGGSGSVPHTKGSGSGRPKNIRILRKRKRTPNTDRRLSGCFVDNNFRSPPLHNIPDISVVRDHSSSSSNSSNNSSSSTTNSSISNSNTKEEFLLSYLEQFLAREEHTYPEYLEEVKISSCSFSCTFFLRFCFVFLYFSLLIWPGLLSYRYPTISRCFD
jgi:hypothetical protein